MQLMQNGTHRSNSPPGVMAALPTAKDALVTLTLPDGAGGHRRFKSHLHTLVKHSRLFAVASKKGTKFKVPAFCQTADRCRVMRGMLQL